MKTSRFRSNVTEELGKLGEDNIRKALIETKSKILSNLYVPFGTSTTEIDIVVILEHNIYVIESKNYRGIIHGKEEDEYWVQETRAGNKFDCNTFYNPIKQNQSHIDALKQFVEEPMVNIVVFSDISKLDVEAKNIVIHTRNLKDKINNIEKASTKSIDVEKIYEVLSAFKQKDEDTKKRHIDDLTKRHSCDII